MKIEFDKYCIRNFKLKDVESLSKYANNINVSRYLRDTFPFPYTKEDAEKWINFLNDNPDVLAFAIADKQEVIGGIGAIPNHDTNRFSVEIGYWLGEPFWNRGITTKAVKAFCNYLFTNFDFNHITASIYEGNDSSICVIQNAGFLLEGILRKHVFKGDKFLDQYIYGILKEEWLLDESK